MSLDRQTLNTDVTDKTTGRRNKYLIRQLKYGYAAVSNYCIQVSMAKFDNALTQAQID